MHRHTLCTNCSKPFRRPARKQSPVGAVRHQVRAWFNRIRQAVSTSAEVKTELRLLSAASLLAGGATVFMVYMVATIFNF